MKSLTGKFASARGWALLFTLFLGAGLFVAGCGEEDAPAPTTPAPTPPPPAPEPEPPAPEKPATPTGFQVASKTSSSITWTWNAVEGAHGYVVQTSADEAFDETDALNLTVQPSFTATDLAAETSVYARVAAGVLTSAAPSVDPKDYLLSDWTTHVTGTTDAVAPDRPPAPANVEVKSRGSNYIEWTWDAVAGAAGYSAEFSLSADFLDSREFPTLQKTSLKISNLDAETDGYLRVRSYTGSGTGEDTVFSEWSATSAGSTDEPPPAVPLGAPSDVSGGSALDDSILVSWDEVDGAETYEVQQRASGGDWTDASCGAGGDNEVDGTECIATGLTRGTSYDFRVRAIPADTVKHATGAWGATSSSVSTTGPAPTTPAPGGMGDLNVRWESNGTSITWIWDRAGEGRYDYVLVDNLIPENADDNPCSGVTWPTGTDSANGTAQTSYTAQNLTGGDVRLLCVRPDDAEKEVSFAWAVSSPAASSIGTPTEKDSDKDNANDTTTGLTWTTFGVKGGFNYEWRAVADPVRENSIKASTSAASIKAACASGIAIETGDSDWNYTVDEIRLTRGLKPHTGYLLCTRYSNTAGSSDWTWQGSDAGPVEATTRPGQPPSPRVDSTRTVETNDTQTVAWEIAVRTASEVPYLPAGFTAKTLVYRQKWVDNSSGTDVVKTTKSPTPANCQEGQGTEGQFALTDITDTSQIKQNSSGVVYISSAISRDAVDTPDLDNRYVHLCVRATHGGNAGPWRLGSRSTVRQQPPAN